MRYSEYKKLPFTKKSISYEIGERKGILFVSLSTLLLTNEECEVRFNGDNKDEDWETIHKDVYYVRERKIIKITVRRLESKDGFLEIWSEGNIAR